jgi:YggT family protein
MLLIRIVDVIFQVYMLMLFVRILASWLPEFQNHRFMQFLAFYTDPYLNFFRRFIPPLGMIDFSPIVAFLCLGVIEQVVKATIVLFIS